MVIFKEIQMIKINNNKAIDITKNKLRAWRKEEFAINDINLQNAMVDNDVTAKDSAIVRRNYLRDLPQACDGKTVKELEVIMSGIGIN